jgi:hypothetical protein
VNEKFEVKGRDSVEGVKIQKRSLGK